MDNNKNFLKKIIDFFKNIFKKEHTELLPEKTALEENIEDTKSSFLEGIQLYRREDPVLLDLQKQYESNKIDLSDLTDEEIHNLNLLYKRQVSELKNMLDNKQTEFNILNRQIQKSRNIS